MIQTTNIRRILDRLTRHNMTKDIPFETAVEYTVDFIQLMGTPALYLEKTAVVPIDNWRGPLPCDFESMIQVRVAGKGSKDKDSVLVEKTNDAFDVHEHMQGEEQRIVSDCKITRFNTGNYPAGAVYRESTYSFHMSPDKMPSDLGELTYKIQGMVIFTSTKDIDIEIAYRAFAVDDEGYPLLPDNASFLRGLESYIKMKWFEDKFDEGVIPQAVMDRADREYAWAAGDAQSEFSRMTIDEAESLFNSFKTLLPRSNEHWNAFFNLGSKEIWRRH